MSSQKTPTPLYKKSWAIILAIFFFLIIIGSLADKKNPTQQDKLPEQSQEKVKLREEAINEEWKKSSYQIVYEVSNKRYDGGKNFYVLVNDINLNNDGFKNDIKKIVDEIVKTKGGKIGIDFINNKEVLDLYYKSHYGSNTLGRILNKSEVDKVGQSLVAKFSGELKADIYLNTLSFFPGTFTDDPKVGKYVETIEYNPNK